MCWAFDEVPSNVNDVLWSFTHADIKSKINLKYGLLYADRLQDYLTLASVISAVLGGKKSKGKKSEPQRSEFANVDEAKAALARVLGGGKNGSHSRR